MAKRSRRGLPADLARVRDRLAAWRRTRKPGARIPEALWRMAVKPAGRYGVHRTARTLKLDYYSLKKRTLPAEGPPAKHDSAFVELPAVLTPVPECVIELEDGAGTLRVRLTGYRAADIAAVGRGLRGSH